MARLNLPIRNPNYPDVMTAVYRLYDSGGRLLYVGVTEDIDVRFAQHASTKPWWGEVARRDVTWFPTRLDALYEEQRAIRDERPVHNVRPGIRPFGLIPFAYSIRDGRVYEEHGPVAVTKDDIDDVLRKVAHGRMHAAVVYEGELLNVVVVPVDWYRRACEALGQKCDLDALPAYEAAVLYGTERDIRLAYEAAAHRAK